MKPARLPRRVTLLVWLVFILTVWNATRFYTAIVWRGILAEKTAWPGPGYIALTGFIWAAVGIWITIVVIQRKKWSAMALLISALGYTVWYWLDRLFLQTERDNWGFTLVVNAILLAFVWYATRSNYFKREAYEQRSES